MSSVPCENEIRELLIRNTRILVIEDDKSTVDTVIKGLSDRGYSPDKAYDAKEARSYILETIYDLIIVDIILPDLFGDQLLKQLGERILTSKVVLTSASIEEMKRVQQSEYLYAYKLLAKQYYLEYVYNFLGDYLKEREALFLPRIDSIIEIIKKSILKNKGIYGLESDESRKVRSLYITWLNELPNANVKYFSYNGKDFSPKDIVKEIDMGTEVGKEHFDMFLDFLEEFIKRETN